MTLSKKAKRLDAGKQTSKVTAIGMYDRLPAAIAAVVRSKIIDLRHVSLFCRRQAECAALFGQIVEVNPGRFVLKSPFRENLIGSLPVYLWQNARFTPQEIVATALVWRTKWYLSILDSDTLRARAGKAIEPRLLRGSMSCIAGIIRLLSGEFTTDPEADGNPAVLAWQHGPVDPPAIAIEVSGIGATFSRRLLESISNCLAIQLNLKRANPGSSLL